MDKAANAVRQSGERFLLLIDRLDRWLKDNHAKAIEMFTQLIQMESTWSLIRSLKPVFVPVILFCVV